MYFHLLHKSYYFSKKIQNNLHNMEAQDSSLPTDFWKHLDPRKKIIATSIMPQMALTFSMVRHPRLGSNSIFHDLNTDILQLILQDTARVSVTLMFKSYRLCIDQRWKTHQVDPTNGSHILAGNSILVNMPGYHWLGRVLGFDTTSQSRVAGWRRGGIENFFLTTLYELLSDFTLVFPEYTRLPAYQAIVFESRGPVKLCQNNPAEIKGLIIGFLHSRLTHLQITTSYDNIACLYNQIQVRLVGNSIQLIIAGPRVNISVLMRAALFQVPRSTRVIKRVCMMNGTSGVGASKRSMFSIIPKAVNIDFIDAAQCKKPLTTLLE